MSKTHKRFKTVTPARLRLPKREGLDHVLEHQMDIERGVFWLYGDVDKEAAVSFSLFSHLLLQGPPRTIDLRINSEGGDVSQGISIFNDIGRLSDARFKVTGTVNGECESIALYVLQACEQRRAYPTSTLMWHTGQVEFPERNPFELRNCLKVYTDLSEQMDRTVFARLNREIYPDVIKFSKAMDRSITLLADEAKEHGFIDEVIR
jgi:ATP-dependent protease ClpP protease subunit